LLHTNNVFLILRFVSKRKKDIKVESTIVGEILRVVHHIQNRRNNDGHSTCMLQRLYS